ncbi:MAG TPA: PIN domain-containing protein [Acidimicrobiales bacterium]|nr:PIN domain-containing protein [Acidimicrobiales bacterium]
MDTNVLGWLLQDRDDERTNSYRALIGPRRIVVPFQVVAEIRFGMMRARWGELRVRRTERALAELLVAQPDDLTLTTYARLRDWAVAQGHPIGAKSHDGDRWIAAVAVRADHPLVTHDSVFQEVDGLRVLTVLGAEEPGAR